MFEDNQHKTRKKYKHIRCPYCDATSHIKLELAKGTQIRICKQGHQFLYSYIAQAILQKVLNYKVKI